MTHVSDTLRTGDAFYGAAQQSDGGFKGISRTPIGIKEFGSVAALTATGIAVNASATTAGAISATGSLVSGGVATLTPARNVTLTATVDMSSLTFTINGTDQYGETQTETIAGPNATTSGGKKAFKTVTSIVATGGTITSPLSAGSGDVLGLPWLLQDLGKFMDLRVDGVGVAPTLVKGIGATGVATATNGDSRGTFTSTVPSDGTKMFTIEMIVVPTTKENLYGPQPF